MAEVHGLTGDATFAPREPDRRICNDRRPMPSPVGHALAGVAAAWTADLIPGDRAWRTAPPQASWYRRAGNGLTAVCVALAAAPDLDLLSRSHRTYTHSIGAVVLAGLLAAIVAAKYRRPVARIALMCA